MAEPDISDLPQLITSPIPQVDCSDTPPKLRIRANHIVTPMADSRSYYFYSEANCFFKSLGDFDLDVTIHVVEVVEQNHEVAVSDFMNDLVQSRSFTDFPRFRFSLCFSLDPDVGPEAPPTSLSSCRRIGYINPIEDAIPNVLR
jgi:hypothetical protein